VAALKTWLEKTLVQLASGSSIAQAIRYGLNQTDPFLNSAPAKALLIRKLSDPSPEFETNSKMVIFDIVVFNG
jgi:hypothetical protein